MDFTSSHLRHSVLRSNLFNFHFNHISVTVLYYFYVCLYCMRLRDISNLIKSATYILNNLQSQSDFTFNCTMVSWFIIVTFIIDTSLSIFVFVFYSSSVSISVAAAMLIYLIIYDISLLYFVLYLCNQYLLLSCLLYLSIVAIFDSFVIDFTTTSVKVVMKSICIKFL